MNSTDFLQFRRNDFCSDEELFNLTQKQMEDIANTKLPVKSFWLDKEIHDANLRRLAKPAKYRIWRAPKEEII